MSTSAHSYALCEQITERIIDLIEGELPRDQAERAAEHMRRCPCCAAMKASFEGVRTLVRRSMEEPLTDAQRAALAQAVLDGIAADAPTPARA